METAPKVETISLTPKEKAMYENCLVMHPYMDMKTWKKFRDEALAAIDAKEKQFWNANGMLTEEKPDIDSRKEWSVRNLN